jgi:hypothetical protein
MTTIEEHIIEICIDYMGTTEKVSDYGRRNLRKMTLSITTLRIITLSIMTFSLLRVFILDDTMHSVVVPCLSKPA